MKKILLLLTLVLSFNLFSQEDETYLKYDPLNKPNTYNIPDNPNYWKNKMPYEGYWQQDVHYEINAEINAEDNTIYANQTLTYWNNSPDDLDYVYFHLYQNAFKEDSYYTELKKINYRVDPEFDGFGVGTEISSISSNGEELD